MNIQPDLKDKALEISPLLVSSANFVSMIRLFTRFCFELMKFLFVQCLDEVQSYILVQRSVEKHNVALDSIVQEFFHVVSLLSFLSL